MQPPCTVHWYFIMLIVIDKLESLSKNCPGRARTVAGQSQARAPSAFPRLLCCCLWSHCLLLAKTFTLATVTRCRTVELPLKRQQCTMHFCLYGMFIRDLPAGKGKSVSRWCSNSKQHHLTKIWNVYVIHVCNCTRNILLITNQRNAINQAVRNFQVENCTECLKRLSRWRPRNSFGYLT